MAICKNKACGNKFKPTRPFQKGCCQDCEYVIAMDFLDKKRAKEASARKNALIKLERDKRQKLKARKEALRPHGYYVKQAQTWFNRFIRMRDEGKRCISCDKPFQFSFYIRGQLFDAGHYRSVGSCPELRFEELNVNLQCVHCNRDLSGNVVEYRKRLLIKIGIKKLDWLEGPHEAKHYTIDDLKEITAKYKAKCKQLQNEREKIEC